VPLELIPATADDARADRDERDFSDPNAGKGFIMHSVRGFIQEMTRGLFNWSEQKSIWPLTFGIKCCAIEMMAFGAGRFDSDRMGVFFRASPRQADLMIVAGPATIKLRDVITRLYDQMPEPKYVIAFGECAICGGPFWDSYSVINGVDKLIPVDIYVPGCPPRPEQLLLAIQKLQEKIDEKNRNGLQTRMSTTVIGVPNIGRDELLAQVMSHPTYRFGIKDATERFTPTPEELARATPTAQPSDWAPTLPIMPPKTVLEAAAKAAAKPAASVQIITVPPPASQPESTPLGDAQ
jgi:NADH-quinone oxidoreductase subunit B